MPFDYDTVKSLERLRETPSRLRQQEFRKVPDTLGGRFIKGRVKNFTCPACGKRLAEAITIDGEVRGWCGNTHQYVGG